MTNGSSQGLFTIVAVVIFGIFVAISYIIFKDTLQPTLANIFKDSVEDSYNQTFPYNEIIDFSKPHNNNISRVSDEFIISNISKNHSGSSLYPAGIQNASKKEVPWEHKILFSYEVFIPDNNNNTYIYSIDFNTYPENIEDSWNINDNFGSSNFKDNSKMYIGNTVESNKWVKIDVWYANDSQLNLKKESIYESLNGKGSVLGLQTENFLNTGIQSYKIRNVQYKVVPI